jgi:hypothetical protein
MLKLLKSLKGWLFWWSHWIRQWTWACPISRYCSFICYRKGKPQAVDLILIQSDSLLNIRRDAQFRIFMFSLPCILHITNAAKWRLTLSYWESPKFEPRTSSVIQTAAFQGFPELLQHIMWYYCNTLHDHFLLSPPFTTIQLYITSVVDKPNVAGAVPVQKYRPVWGIWMVRQETPEEGEGGG